MTMVVFARVCKIFGSLFIAAAGLNWRYPFGTYDPTSELLIAAGLALGLGFIIHD